MFGGFHLVDLLIVAAIALLLFGPKTVQSLARNAGKGLGQAKVMKDKLMSELPLEEISKVTESIPQVPLNPRQAVQMAIASELSGKKEKKEKSEKTPSSDEERQS